MGNDEPPAYDGPNMKRIRTAAAALLVAIGSGLVVAAPAQADPSSDAAFLTALSDSGVTGIDPATATEVGQQVCPMLAEPGQRMADVAGEVADSLGKPLGPATLFTGLAITIFCPGAVASLANGESPIPLGLLGI